MELVHGSMHRIVVRVEVVLRKVLLVLIVEISVDQVNVSQEQVLIHFQDHAHGSIHRVMKEIIVGIVLKRMIKLLIVKILIEYLNVLLEEE
jgi:hypothetical protein